MSKKLTASHFATAFISAALGLTLGGCLQVNPNYKPQCYDSNNNVGAHCSMLGDDQYCSPTKYCVTGGDTVDANYPTRVEGALAIVFPFSGKVVGGNTLIVASMPNEVAKVEFWAIDARMTHIPLGESVNGSFAWKPRDTSRGATKLFVRAFDAAGKQIGDDSPEVAVIVTE